MNIDYDAMVFIGELMALGTLMILVIHIMKGKK